MEQQENNFDRIAPAAVKLGNTRPAAADSIRTDTNRIALLPMVALAVLVCVALGVIFVLPKWQTNHNSVPISTAPPPTAPNAAPASAPTPPPAATADAASEAERAVARSAAQDLLERVRELDRSLKEIGVETWAAADYQGAVAQLAAGDRAYQSLDYPVARAAYEAALTQLDSLMQKAGTVFSEAMARGNQALNEGNGKAAATEFQLALLIRPDDSGAKTGAARTGKIDQVMDLMGKGEELVRAGDLAAAATLYQQAADLDPDFAPALERLQSVRRELGAQAYRTAMSAGFAALSNGQLSAARGHFSDALRMQPGSPEATDALRQVETRLTSSEIEQHLSAARAAEQTEDWGAAAMAYEAALKLDANLQAAQSGRGQAIERHSLDLQLAQAIAKPERLGDDGVYEETSALLARAGSVAAPGAKLKQQIAVLTALQQESRTPVPVTLISDGETDITIYRVGRMGKFVSKEMTLRPGRYVATGVRTGYRDVRVEFMVSATGAPAPIQVQCTQRIGAGT